MRGAVVCCLYGPRLRVHQSGTIYPRKTHMPVKQCYRQKSRL